MILRTLNVYSKGRGFAEIMERRLLYYVQETRQKRSKARCVSGGFKLFYQCVDRRRNKAGVILREEYAKSFLEVKSVKQSDECEAENLKCDDKCC